MNDKTREEFKKTGDLLETYNDYGFTDPTWNYTIWLENRLKSRDEEIRKLKFQLNGFESQYIESGVIIENLKSDKRDLIRECLYLANQSEQSESEIEYNVKRFTEALKETS